MNPIEKKKEEIHNLNELLTHSIRIGEDTFIRLIRDELKRRDKELRILIVKGLGNSEGI
jgi:hypothetical protein